jgi:hypothetical protein
MLLQLERAPSRLAAGVNATKWSAPVPGAAMRGQQAVFGES